MINKDILNFAADWWLQEIKRSKKNKSLSRNSITTFKEKFVKVVEQEFKCSDIINISTSRGVCDDIIYVIASKCFGWDKVNLIPIGISMRITYTGVYLLDSNKNIFNTLFEV
ncbi:MAG: hypothetical protein RSB76_01935 [Clostridia bacterium]